MITEAPPVPDAMFRTTGELPTSITDLRTGQKITFRMLGGILLEQQDWSDVDQYGAKVLKVIF